MARNIQEYTGDIRKEFGGQKWDGICCTINTVVETNGLVMGAGIAKIFAERFPSLPRLWGDKISTWNLPRHTYVLATPVYRDAWWVQYAIGFPTKYDWKMPSPISLIERSAKQLRILIEAMDWQNVLLPRPGCANGGLSWKDVKQVLQPILDSRVTIISEN